MDSAPIVTSLILGARSHCGISVSTALAHELEIHFLTLNPRLLKSVVDYQATFSSSGKESLEYKTSSM